MFRPIAVFLLFVASGLLVPAHAQSPLQTSGTLVTVPAAGEVKHRNDEAHLTFMLEEQDKDKSAAASRVNRKMKEGTDLIRREEPQAVLQTRGYYTYPVYPEQPTRTGQHTGPNQPVGWRVGQYLEVTTSEIAHLPALVASAQRLLALNGLSFGLSDATRRQLEQQGIASAYENLMERASAVAKAMGRSLADAKLESVDFDASAPFEPQRDVRMAKALHMSPEAASVEEPSFEPGDTTLSMRIVGKVRFK